MTRSPLRRVFTYPARGFSGQKWVPADPVADPAWPVDEADSFLRSSRPVAEAISRELVPLALPVPDGEVQLFLLSGVASGRMEVNPEFSPRYGFEAPRIRLVEGFHELAPATRRRLIYECWETVLVEMAGRHGWNAGEVSAILTRLRVQGAGFDCEGPWRRARAGGPSARLEGELKDDGFFRLRVAFRADDGSGDVRRSESFVGGSTASSFEHAARQLRWRGDQVALDSTLAPGKILEFGLVTVDSQTGRVRVESGPAMPIPSGAEETVSEADVEVALVAPDEWPFITGRRDVPLGEATAYVAAQTELISEMQRQSEWQAWWRLLGRDEIHVDTLLHARASRIQVTFRDDYAVMSISHPWEDRRIVAEGRDLARQDLAAALASLAMKAALPPAPPFHSRS